MAANGRCVIFDLLVITHPTIEAAASLSCSARAYVWATAVDKMLREEENEVS